MTTIHRWGDGQRIAFMKGAPEIVLEKCAFIQGHRGFSPLTAEKREEILRMNEKMAQGALRVLGVSFREISEDLVWVEDAIEHDLVFLGLVGMMDPPREEAIEAVKICRQVQIKLIMITGDDKLTV